MNREEILKNKTNLESVAVLFMDGKSILLQHEDIWLLNNLQNIKKVIVKEWSARDTITIKMPKGASNE